jgi:hypothetical protein
MAKLIEFYVPRNFTIPKSQWQPAEQDGKIIEFSSAARKKSA